MYINAHSGKQTHEKKNYEEHTLIHKWFLLHHWKALNQLINCMHLNYVPYPLACPAKHILFLFLQFNHLCSAEIEQALRDPLINHVMYVYGCIWECSWSIINSFMPNSYSLIVIHKSLVFVCLKKSCRSFVFDTLKRKTLAVLSGSALDCALPGSECKKSF